MTPQTAPRNPDQSPVSAASMLRPQPSGAGKRNRVLILEDELAFREALREFLVGHGFDVVAVQNGVDGVHEMLATDFDVILCDMMMPTMPGDMFYRAVARMRPHLCDRFVFMTGHREVPTVNELILQANGTVLMKPFAMDDLLELIAFIQVRRAVQAVA